ncbi:MAG: serpin family protein, partial [Clostridia bacterium]|nr:serpin family protein [Clostridia bacterium]
LPAASDGPAVIRTTSPTECPTELLTPTPEPVTLRFLTDSAFSTSRKAEALGGDFKSAYARIALESLRKAYVKGQNTVLSPLSVITALALTANGARGTTQKQALELWSGEWDIDRLNEQLFSFREKLEADTDCRLVNADAVFLTEREDFIVNENYISLVSDTYRAQIAQLDFQKAGAAGSVNRWISDHTGGLIPAVLRDGDVNINTMMLLVNALCFDAEWAQPLQEAGKQVFHGVSGDRKTDWLWSYEYGYIAGDNETGFVKTYKGDQYAFVALLPREDLSVDAYLELLDGSRFLSLLKNVQYDLRTIVSMPAFTASTDTDLRALLSALGLESWFVETADFTGLGTMADGSGVGLGKARHCSSFELGAAGTKAAASSVVSATAAATSPPWDAEVRLDRPFVYAVIDLATGLPVFAGVFEGA